ncbi:MAG: hypothetical protein HDS73_06510 [Bacteroidales bacterium]|nr:hypothetical protein [Bacteroidales bacterium]
MNQEEGVNEYCQPFTCRNPTSTVMHKSLAEAMPRQGLCVGPVESRRPVNIG